MSRLLILLYGILGYVLFLFTILYAIGFVGDFGVPKTINDGETVSRGEMMLVNGVLLSLFVVQHTVMARPAFKRWWTRWIPSAIERSTFVILASAILLLLFWQWRPDRQWVWQIEAPLPAAMLTGIQLAGWGIVFYSSFLIDHFDLFGVRQTVLHARQKAYTQHPFIERSLYKLVRHPLMAGFLIAFWSTPAMSVGHLFFAVMTTAYIFFGVGMEERDLLKHHGAEYREYRSRTPMILPIRIRPVRGEVRDSSPLAKAGGCPFHWMFGNRANERTVGVEPDVLEC